MGSLCSEMFAQLLVQDWGVKIWDFFVHNLGQIPLCGCIVSAMCEMGVSVCVEGDAQMSNTGVCACLKCYVKRTEEVWMFISNGF